MIVNVLFYVFGAILVLTALGVITARNPVHCALFLVAAFLNSAVIWLLLEAEFLAVTLIVVYVGAVMVLWLFVVMMMDVDVAKLRQGFTRYAPLGALIALIVVAQIVNGMLLPILLVFILRLVNDRRIMGKYTNNTVQNIIAWGITVVLSLLSFIMILSIILPAVGIPFLQ